LKAAIFIDRPSVNSAMLALAGNAQARKQPMRRARFIEWTDNRQPTTDNRLCPIAVILSGAKDLKLEILRRLCDSG
jgi:hypothetical protein